VKQISLLEVNRFLPQFRDAGGCSREHLDLLKTSSAAFDAEQQTERDDQVDDGPRRDDRVTEAAEADGCRRHCDQR
jgi:hypothetical protein